MGLTPLFKLIANDKDVTDDLTKVMESISFHDENGIKADKLAITVSKSLDGYFKRPKYKDELKLYLYYQKEKKEFYSGLFIVQNTTAYNDGSLTINATATNFNKNLKVYKSRSFKAKSIKKIVGQIASENNLKVKCDYDHISFPYIAQTNESDISFLLRLSKDYHAVYGIKNNTIIFLRQDEKSILKTVTIDANKCVGNTPIIKNSNKTYYKSVTLKYQDTKQNKIKTIKVGSGEPTYNMQDTFIDNDKDNANLKFKAKAKLQELNKGIKSGSFKIGGFGIYARSKLKFLNINSEDNVTYHIDKIVHTLDDNGWNMNVEFS